MPVAIGDTFTLGQGGHLWMVITHPDGADGRFIMVNMTSLRLWTVDRSCILHVGDHPLVRHDSVIAYGDAEEWWERGECGYDDRLALQMIQPNAPLDIAVLRRVQDGASASNWFKKKRKPRVQACLVNPS
jgi:hypothetical protein